MTQQKKLLLLILSVTLVSLYIDLPKTPLGLEIKQGLDLQGGLQVVLQAEMGGIAEEQRDTALEAVKNVIEKRVNFFGVTEPTIQTSKTAGQYRIVVELPGVTPEPDASGVGSGQASTEQAIALIGQTAQLDFREPVFTELPPESTESASITGFKETDLTGKDLEKAGVTFEQNTNTPQIAIKFTDEGAEKFEEITKRNIGQPLAIFLDGQVISAPRVNEAISGGEAVISGQFNLEEAKNLAIQLNAGALPVPITILEQRSIGATLGQNSVQKSLVAGVVGLGLVAFFMIAYYKRLGLLATVGLIIYGLITLALYKLIPVTLTLAGMAGFLLSIGMAVDANILIFEKIKEEKRAGRPSLAAMETGFGRAWDSIRDANICTLITCFVLFNPLNWNFLNASGMIRGFALTLGLGIFVSLFTGVVVTRTLIRVFYK